MDENDTLKKEASEQTQRHIDVCCSYACVQSMYVCMYVSMGACGITVHAHIQYVRMFTYIYCSCILNSPATINLFID